MTEKKVRSECAQRMIADHLAAIHNKCPAMAQQELKQDLLNAFALLKVKRIISFFYVP